MTDFCTSELMQVEVGMSAVHTGTGEIRWFGSRFGSSDDSCQLNIPLGRMTA